MVISGTTLTTEEIRSKMLRNSRSTINQLGKSVLSLEATEEEASGAGIVLETLDHMCIQYALRFKFQASNNTAEYEALLVGLKLAANMGTQYLEVFSNSQLVVNQIVDAYQAKKEHMKSYLQRVKELIRKFQKYRVALIPRAENSKTDMLAKLTTADEDQILRSIPIEFFTKRSINEAELVTVLLVA
ncbi:uncharacterized protein LOC131224916 [Magnolia sinica]|uniref:uncharacterized protein LOC131224916 n=1 Tax=Magnolia sinica TaxID=86752 RepID=UPI002659BAC6|nr:uncharacterized protein LOC131224916 [Magnolia sinica]